MAELGKEYRIGRNVDAETECLAQNVESFGRMPSCRYLEEGDEDSEFLGRMLWAANGGKEILDGPRDDAASVSVLAEYGVGLAGAGLSISKYAGVVAFENMIHLRQNEDNVKK
jgi:hypothetical protein